LDAPDGSGRPAALSGWSKKRLLQVARGDAKRLGQRAGVASAAGYASIVEAGLAFGEGRTEAALSLLERSGRAFEDADMPLHAAAAARGLAVAKDHPEHRARAERGDAWMRGEGVVAPERMARMLAPATLSVRSST
jgi:hypothetical protein